jgi:hypothetical protein
VGWGVVRDAEHDGLIEIAVFMLRWVTLTREALSREGEKKTGVQDARFFFFAGS